jgi:8-oxo-dGTP pyrophosphatase MutT (NUDIX family)
MTNSIPSPDASRSLQSPPFIRSLARALRSPLPGREAQLRMATSPRHSDHTDQCQARRGGVLILFYPWAGQIHIPFILRPVYDGVHSGQIAFPGGGQESVDDDLTATALREAYEEIGIPSPQVQVLGHLSEVHISASNYLVVPTVGWLPSPPIFRLDPYEVADVIQVPLTALRDPANRHVEERTFSNQEVIVPYFGIAGHVIWGATAMMLSELLAVIEGMDGST